ncbi:GIN domain-containing protein [Pedobacter sp. GR22-6]|uniref:GIN domain-containing protein n=1 Tax=Pedobacter sp. GR22-6 TaxID=3127957 RepID=UPI00307F0504
MKSLIKTTFATLLTAVVMTSSAFSNAVAKPVNSVKMLSINKSFNKIWVGGNVKIILTQSENEGVFVDENFNADQTSVTSAGSTLYINSMESGQVTIKVSVKDLQRIEAAGSAVVVTSNNFDVKYLQLFLSQNAKAKVSAITGSLYTVIKDDATLKMSGMAHEHTLVASNMKNVKLTDFVCKRNNNNVPVAEAARLAGLAK